MLIVPEKPFLRRRTLAAPVRPAPQPLELVAAEYDPDETTLRMTFDRAVNIAHLNGSAFTVADGIVHGYKFHILSATLDGPTTIVATLTEFDSATKPETTLTATPANGILAADDGGTWEGVNGAGLPFGVQSTAERFNAKGRRGVRCSN